MEAADILVSAVLSVVLNLYLAGNLYWVYQVMARVVSYNAPPLEHGGDAIEVRTVIVVRPHILGEVQFQIEVVRHRPLHLGHPLDVIDLVVHRAQNP
jgi:hypothetical protein